MAARRHHSGTRWSTRCSDYSMLKFELRLTLAESRLLLLTINTIKRSRSSILSAGPNSTIDIDIFHIFHRDRRIQGYRYPFRGIDTRFRLIIS